VLPRAIDQVLSHHSPGANLNMYCYCKYDRGQEMAKIYVFPNKNRTLNRTNVEKNSASKTNWLNRVYILSVLSIRAILTIFWIPIKWILSIDCFFQFLKILYYWDNPESHAIWTFLLNFSLLTALMIFMASSKQIKNFSR
jgi:Uncharacterized KleE stable inheritance protein